MEREKLVKVHWFLHQVPNQEHIEDFNQLIDSIARGVLLPEWVWLRGFLPALHGLAAVPGLHRMTSVPGVLVLSEVRSEANTTPPSL